MTARTSLRVTVAVFAATVLAAPAGPVSARSAVDCTSVVHDPNGVLGLPGEVENAALALAGLAAAEVHVRVPVGLADGVDAEMARLEAACEGWRSNGLRAPDLIVVMVDPDRRQTGIYYGDAHVALDGDWESIQANEMNPSFAAGDIDGGLLAGLSALAESTRATDSEPQDSNAGTGIALTIGALVIAGGAAFAMRSRGSGGRGSGSGRGNAGLDALTLGAVLHHQQHGHAQSGLHHHPGVGGGMGGGVGGGGGGGGSSSW